MEAFLKSESLIYEFSDDLGFTVAKEQPRIRRWIYRAVADIGNYRIAKKTTDIDIEDLAAKKPIDFVALDNAMLVGSSGECYQVYFDMRSIACCGKCGNSSKYVLSDQDGIFCLSSNASTFKTLRIAYYGPPMDEDGNPLVPGFMYEAVKAYVTWKWLQRKRNKNQEAPSRLNPVALSELQMAEGQWLRERRAAKAQRMYPKNAQEAKQIAERFIYRHTNTYPRLIASHCSTFFRSCA